MADEVPYKIIYSTYMTHMTSHNNRMHGIAGEKQMRDSR